MRNQIDSHNGSILNQVDAATDPANALIKQEIMESITKKKEDIKNLKDKLAKLRSNADDDYANFLRFAYEFIDNMGNKFFEISRENRLRCKELLFPAGFYVNSHKKVYTPEISILIRLASNKKDLPKLEKSSLVRVQGL